MCLEAARWVQTLELNENLERERERKKKRKKYIYLSGRKKKRRDVGSSPRKLLLNNKRSFSDEFFFRGKKDHTIWRFFYGPAGQLCFLTASTHTQKTSKSGSDRR